MNDATDSRAHDCPWRDSAAMHVLGHVERAESERFHAHLGECAACRAEFDDAQLAVAELDWALAREEQTTLAAPSPSVRERLLASVASEGTPELSTNGAAHPAALANALDRSWRRWNQSEPEGASREGFGPGLYAVGANEGRWERVGGCDGVEVKRLATDIERRMVTMLIRMAPGSAYPRHRHAAKEECYVIAGDLKIGARPMSAGDYQLAEVDSIHEVQSTERGCLLLITSSQDDELLP